MKAIAITTVLFCGITAAYCLQNTPPASSPNRVLTVMNPYQTNQGPDHNKLNGDERWGLSDKIAAIASAAAVAQFLALIITIGIMILNGRRQLRAYVIPENGGILDGTMLNPPDPAKANIPGCGLQIKNSGQTPAYKVVSWAGMAVVFPRDERQLVMPPIEDRFSNVLGANGFFSKFVWLDRPLTPNEIAEIATGTRAIYLYGRVEYRDAFKKKRFTNFRLHYQGISPPHPNALLSFSEKGNDAN